MKNTSVRKESLIKNSLIGLIIAGVILALGELLLHAVGVEPLALTEDPYVGYASTAPLFVENASNGEMVTAPGKRDWFNLQKFKKNKPEGGYRIFCLGGSTTYGRPYCDSMSFSAWLRVFLPRAFPTRQWEVVNAGGISYASYRVAQLMQELIQYQPDLFILYSGHNEYLEERTYRRIAEIPAFLRETNAFLGRTRLFSAFQLAYRNLAGDSYRAAKEKYNMGKDVRTLLDEAYGPSTYKRDDTLKTRVLVHYRHSLRRIIGLARSAGAEILMITTPSNLSHCSPFKSQTSVKGEALERFKTFMARGAQFEASGQPDSSLLFFRKSAKIDSRHADALYRTGKGLFQAGRFQKAGKYLRAARDEDICPLRAISPMRGIVLETARELQTPLVDFEELLMTRSQKKYGHKILGEDDFLDHVHFTVENHGLLARQIIKILTDWRIAELSPNWNEALADEISRKFLSRLDDKSRGAALHNLAKVLNWAGKQEDAAVLAEKALRLAPGHIEAVGSHLYVATALERRGKTREAIPHYWNSLSIDSHNLEARLLLGRALLRIGDTVEAVPQLTAVLEASPKNISLMRDLHAVWIKTGRADLSVRYISRIIQLLPGDAILYVLLGQALSYANRLSEAVSSFQRALQLNPKSGEAWLGLGKISQFQGDRGEAINCYSRALKLNPGLEEARFLLSNALGEME